MNDVAYSSNGESLAVAADGGLFLLDPSDLSEQAFIRSETTPHSVAFSPDSEILALANDAQIFLFDLVTRTPASEIRGLRGAVRDLAFSSDGSILVSASSDEVILWDGASATEAASLEHPALTVPGFESFPGSIYRTWISPDARFLLTVPAASVQFNQSWQLRTAFMTLSELRALNAAYLASPLPRILLWDLADGSSTTTFMGDAAAFSADGEFVVSTWEGRIELRALADLTVSRLLEASGVGSDLEDIALSGDGGLVAVASWDSIGCGATIGIWDTESGQERWRYCYDAEFPVLEATDEALRMSGGLQFHPSGQRLLAWRYGALLSLNMQTGSVDAHISEP